LSRLIRAMGAYFIRRGSRNALYRRVLARYVQTAAAEGATQAFFPEGGLSLDGRVGPARMGLLGYVVQGFDPAGRDVVFVPVGLAYDRVLEDRLLTEADRTGIRRFRARPLSILAFVARTALRLIRRRFGGFGTAAVGFGAPVSLRAALAKGMTTEGLGAHLMAEIARVVPVVPVPLIAAALAQGPASRAELAERIAALAVRLVAEGAILQLAPQGMARTLDEGLAPLIGRGIVTEGPGGTLTPAGDGARLLQFYAAPVLQRLERVSAMQQT